MAQLPAPLAELLDAWNARDTERMLPLLHPEVEIRGLRAALEKESYHGLDGARRFFRDSEESWERIVAELRDFETFGDRVATTMRMRLRARESQVELERSVGLLFELDAGRVRAWLTYLEPSDAYDAAAAGYPSGA